MRSFASLPCLLEYFTHCPICNDKLIIDSGLNSIANIINKRIGNELFILNIKESTFKVVELKNKSKLITKNMFYHDPDSSECIDGKYIGDNFIVDSSYSIYVDFYCSKNVNNKLNSGFCKEYIAEVELRLNENTNKVYLVKIVKERFNIKDPESDNEFYKIEIDYLNPVKIYFTRIKNNDLYQYSIGYNLLDLNKKLTGEYLLSLAKMVLLLQ